MREKMVNLQVRFRIFTAKRDVDFKFLSFFKKYVLVILFATIALPANAETTFENSIRGCNEGDIEKTRSLIELSDEKTNYYLGFVNKVCSKKIITTVAKEYDLDRFDVLPIVLRFPDLEYTKIFGSGLLDIVDDNINTQKIPYFKNGKVLNEYVSSILELFYLKPGSGVYKFFVNYIASQVSFGNGGIQFFSYNYNIDKKIYYSFQSVSSIASNEMSINYCKRTGCSSLEKKPICNLIDNRRYFELKNILLDKSVDGISFVEQCESNLFLNIVLLRTLGFYDRRCSTILQHNILSENPNAVLNDCSTYIHRIRDLSFDSFYDGYFLLSNYKELNYDQGLKNSIVDVLQKQDKNVLMTIEIFNLN